jgi:mannosyltransferase OCH1-like enzyme
MIPKILIQTSYEPIEPYVTEKLKKYISDDWTYLYFNDVDIKDFFRENPLYEFPEIEKVFDSFTRQHKADLFRYYFLYIKGGVFIDSDAMLRCSLDEVVNDCDLFCVVSLVDSENKPTRIYNGFIGTTPKHQIIYDALVDAYNTNPKVLDTNYHLFCTNLATIVMNHPFSNTKKLYEDGGTSEYNIICDSEQKPLLFHYHYHPKIIPKDLI